MLSRLLCTTSGGSNTIFPPAPFLNPSRIPGGAGDRERERDRETERARERQRERERKHERESENMLLMGVARPPTMRTGGPVKKHATSVSEYLEQIFSSSGEI